MTLLHTLLLFYNLLLRLTSKFIFLQEHSYEDVFFAKHKHKRHKDDLGQEFVVKDMMKAFNKSFDDIKKMLDTFAEATHQNSAMTYSEFCKYLDLEEEVSIQAKERASRNGSTVD